MNRAFLLFLAIGILPAVCAADLISSTPGGGLWSDSSTWIGGTVPGSADDVTIAGPVQVAATATCLSLVVLPEGALSGASSGPSTLTVGATVHNQGTIQDGLFHFYLELGGDLVNDRLWVNRQTTLAGSTDRQLSMDPLAEFSSDLVFDPSAAGNVLVMTPFTITGNVNLGEGRMILAPGCPLTLNQSRFEGGQLLCHGNELRFVSWSYLFDCDVNEAVLIGSVEASALVRFTGGVTVMDTLQNLRSTGNSHIDIQGGLINKGLIRNDQYGFTIDLGGDLLNNGEISCSWVALDGATEHHLSMGSGGYFDAQLFLPEFTGGTILASGDLHFGDGVSLGGGTLILEPGSSLRLSHFGAVNNGELLANGNAIQMSGSASLGFLRVDAAVLRGQVEVTADVDFTGGVTVIDTLQNREFAAAEITISGPLLNEGLIRDNVHSLTITALGDLENRGTWKNARVVLEGTENQTVGAGPGIAVPDFSLAAGISASTYQWFKDGELLPGENAYHLTLATVGAARYGSYHCVGDGSVISRTIVIAENAGVTAVPAPVVVSRLEQNQPNPFNPQTRIAFELPRAGRVSLRVHDARGRLVRALLDGTRPAGRHEVTWTAKDDVGRPVASGVYLCVMESADGVVSRKMCVSK